jgi:hypothetical protein
VPTENEKLLKNGRECIMATYFVGINLLIVCLLEVRVYIMTKEDIKTAWSCLSSDTQYDRHVPMT